MIVNLKLRAVHKQLFVINRCVKDKLPEIKTNGSLTTSSHKLFEHNSFGIVTVQFEVPLLEFNKLEFNNTNNNQLKTKFSDLFTTYNEEKVKNLTVLAKGKKFN